MWIDATGGENELGPVGAVGAGGKECVAGTGVASTGVACTRSETRVADIGMWGSSLGAAGGIRTCGGSI